MSRVRNNMKKVTFLFNLGDEVSDPISGATGIVTFNCKYLNGCHHCGVTLKITASNEVKTVEFDESQLVLVKEVEIPNEIRTKKQKKEDEEREAKKPKHVRTFSRRGGPSAQGPSGTNKGDCDMFTNN